MVIMNNPITWLVSLFVLLTIRNGGSFPTGKVPAHLDQSQTLLYLFKYGYMPPSVANPMRSSGMISGMDYKEALKHFQDMVGIPQTGDMDDETEKMMKSPRCGVHDNYEEDGSTKSNRHKRYVLQGSRWKYRDLTYKISKYPTNIGRQEVEAQIKRSFKVWSDVADIRFRKSDSEDVNIDILFAVGEHGDDDPFDGPGGTLGHAFFPIYGGDVHFDDTESWTTSGYRGTSLYQVAAHEIGHALGLSHTKVQNAMMAPVYRDTNPHLKLHEDDIRGIRALYGINNDADTNGIHDDVLKKNDMCGSKSFDAMVTMKSGITFVFRGSKMYQLHEDGIVPGYPRDIAEEFPGLPNDIDAAFTWFSGKTYILKGHQYWRMENRVVDVGYPKKISFGFPGIPDDIDAAMVWSGNSKIYFFKGNLFWKFDPENILNESQPNDYPKPISNWVGIPNNLQSATQYSNGFTYFFKEGQYWRFNDDEFRVAQFEAHVYPRKTGEWWFGCERHSTLGGKTKVHSSNTREELSIDAQISSQKRIKA